MLKHGAILLLLSIAVVLWSNELSYALALLDSVHEFIASQSSAIFSLGTVGRAVHDTLALFSIPVIIAGIPAGIYWICTKSDFPYFHYLLWTIWVILATTIVLTVNVVH